MPAIFYVPEAYSTEAERLMGRNAAGESFLQGYLSYAQDPKVYAWIVDPKHQESLLKKVQQYAPGKELQIITPDTLHKLREAQVLYLPGPSLSDFAFKRSLFGDTAFSICGLTHTTCTTRVMDGLTNYITAPIQPWDALICTSRVVQKNVERVLQAQVDYLKARLGLQKLVLPQFPIIPLGIHTQDFVFNDMVRTHARNQLKLDPETCAVLFVGRLSFNAKAHPVPMYEALEAVRQKSGKKIVLLECGWHAAPFIQQSYQQAAKAICPSVPVLTLNGRDRTTRNLAYAAADIFCSLSDNIQESFGLTPLEGMAAGLPVVVSDWDGYKDTVRDGVDGFRVKTLMPQAGLGLDLANRYALEQDNYDMYCGYTCCFIGVDVPQTTNALLQLVNSKELRHNLGRAGQQHVREIYDWSKIIPRYERLWAELTKLRLQAQATQDYKPKAMPWPARLDPFFAFANYAQGELTLDTTVALVDPDYASAEKRLRNLCSLTMIDIFKKIIPNSAALLKILQLLGTGPKPCRILLTPFSDQQKPFMFRSLLFLYKFNIIRVI